MPQNPSTSLGNLESPIHDCLKSGSRRQKNENTNIHSHVNRNIGKIFFTPYRNITSLAPGYKESPSSGVVLKCKTLTLLPQIVKRQMYTFIKPNHSLHIFVYTHIQWTHLSKKLNSLEYVNTL